MFRSVRIFVEVLIRDLFGVPSSNGSSLPPSSSPAASSTPAAAAAAAAAAAQASHDVGMSQFCLTLVIESPFQVCDRAL